VDSLFYQCSKCEAIKVEDDFSPRNDGRPRKVNSWCKECVNTYLKEKRRNFTPEERLMQAQYKKAYRQGMRKQVIRKSKDYRCGLTPNEYEENVHKSKWIMLYLSIR
jgi:hypothetical protein